MIASIVGSCVYTAIAATSLALTVVMALVAFALAGLALAAMLGKIKTSIASVSVWLVVVPALTGVLTLAFGIDRYGERRENSQQADVLPLAPMARTPGAEREQQLPTQVPPIATATADASAVQLPPRTQDELHRRVREASRLGRYSEALQSFAQLSDTHKSRSLGDGARCADAVATARMSERTWAEWGRRHADSVVDWNVRLTHWGRYLRAPHEFELRCERDGGMIVARTGFSFRSSDDVVRVIGRLHVSPATLPRLEVFYVLNGLNEVVGGPPPEGAQN